MQLSRHVVSPDDPNNITVEVKDQKGPGGDNHHYLISNFNVESNPSFDERHHLDSYEEVTVMFQYGNPAKGFNGITLESLLAICEHRLQGCETGPHPCLENDEALHYIGRAIDALQRRTRRVQRTADVKQALVDMEAERQTPEQTAETTRRLMEAYHSVPNTNSAVSQLLSQQAALNK